MKKVLSISLVVIALLIVMSSCASLRGSAYGGCSATRGMVGYGNR